MRIAVGGLVRLVAVWLLLWCSASHGTFDVYDFDDEQLRARYLTFVEEMRCPKCQNQNLAGSDSPIAADLRRELHRLLQAGKSDDEIVDFMVARYGDYILYKPRLQSNTLLLWFAPLALLLVGLLVALLIQRGNRRSHAATISDAERARLAALLETPDKES